MTIEEALDDMRQRSELNFEGLNKSFKSTKDKTRQESLKIMKNF